MGLVEVLARLSGAADRWISRLTLGVAWLALPLLAEQLERRIWS